MIEVVIKRARNWEPGTINPKKEQVSEKEKKCIMKLNNADGVMDKEREWFQIPKVIRRSHDSWFMHGNLGTRVWSQRLVGLSVGHFYGCGKVSVAVARILEGWCVSWLRKSTGYGYIRMISEAEASREIVTLEYNIILKKNWNSCSLNSRWKWSPLASTCSPTLWIKSSASIAVCEGSGRLA